MKSEQTVVFDDNFNSKFYNLNCEIIYFIQEIKFQKEVEYLKVKSIVDQESVGWIKAEDSFKVLNTVPQKLTFKETDPDVLIAIENFSKSKLYTKRFITLVNNNIYYALFYKQDFVGLINAKSLDYGHIKPVKFTFKDEVSHIYNQPDLSFPVRFNHYNRTFTANKYFHLSGDEIIGFRFGEKTFWANTNNLYINLEDVQKDHSFNKKDLISEYHKNSIRANTEKYYEIDKLFDTSKNIDKIINDFTSINSGSKLYKPFDINIGIICDEFMYYALKDSANIDYIPFNESMEVNKNYDLVIVVSSWRGIDESWQYIANPKGSKRKILNDLLDEYNNLEIPTVFYSKEDPVNYERFVSIAKHCKYIYTSAKEMIETYIKDTGNTNVDYMQFSINPKYHNPIGKDFTKIYNHDQVIFAGSWMKKYPIRNQETKEIFEGVNQSGKNLNIIDRNYLRELHDYQFPYYLAPYISQTLNHESLMKLHKATSWGINLNSVKYSSTMFANRIYELQAMGNLIISNYSMGVNNEFPYISMVHNQEDVLRILDATTEKEKLEVIAKSISEVMLNHTAYHRMYKILKKEQYGKHMDKPSILVIGENEKSSQSFNQQFYPCKHFIKQDEINDKIIMDYDFVTFFSEKYLYEENYLSNILSGFAYTNADVIEMTHNKTYNFKETVKYNKHLSLIDTQNYFEVKKVFEIPLTEVEQEKENFEKIEEEKILTVIIPIHNNGKYLEDKCYRSLKRSSIFNKMEILMIDDGSTDTETLKVIERLKRRNPDIVYHRFSEGSGSASRPRNKGIEMVKTKYLTFLDPDNEASGDGYKYLLDELLSDEGLDLVLGNVIKEDNSKKSLLNYHYYVVTNNEGGNIVYNPKDFLIKADLRAHSIQALIVKTGILQNNHLKMIEGAAGQDTMFFQELILQTSKFKSIPYVIHIYYAAVDGSVTTTIKKSFFDKYLVLEKERVPFLKKHDLYDIYVNQRFPYYFVNWYYKRLSSVAENEYEYAITILREILDMYIENYNYSDEVFNNILNKVFNIKTNN